MTTRGGTQPDDRNADDRAENLKDQRTGRHMSERDQADLDRRRAAADEAAADRRWAS